MKGCKAPSALSSSPQLPSQGGTIPRQGPHLDPHPASPSHSLGPTGLGKTSITYFKQFFTVRLSHCIWMCHALCKPVLILCIHAILFTLLFLPCVNEILILCFAGFISTSQLPHVSELKLDAAAMFFGSCFVGKAFRGNICDHGCIKCQA